MQMNTGVRVLWAGCLGAMVIAPGIVHADEPPPAARGFQMALRTGYSIPMGKASGEPGDDLSETFSGQVPILVDLGGKLGDNVFLGGYVGLGIGGAGSTVGTACDKYAVSCATASFRLGAELQYHFSPDEKTNPWLGYGIGLESSAVGGSTSRGDFSVAGVGPEFAHLMGGLDFRLSSGFGVGPFVDLSIAQYNQIQVKVPGDTSTQNITNKAIHEWLTIGARFVFWP